MNSSDDDPTSGSESSDEELRSRKKKKEKSKKSKHHKHSKSHKKEKKSKKKHRRKRTPSSSEDSSSEEEWVTKESGTKDQASSEQSAKPAADRDEWMDLGSIIPTYSNESKRAKRQEQKDAKRLQASIESLGQHDRELNPYWKNGGKGLPEEEPGSSQKTERSSTALVGDGGLSWLKKAFLRAKEQAQEEGRSLEEIAAERWGSLENFYEMLEKAEAKANESRHQSRPRYDDSPPRQRRRFQRPRESGSEGSEDDRRRHSRRKRSRSRDRERHKHYRYEAKSEKTSWKKSNPDAVSVKTEVEERVQEAKVEETLPEPGDVNQRISDEEEVSQPVTQEDKPAVLTDKEMNELSAKILKAEMLGNQELVVELTRKKEAAEKARKEYVATGKTEQVKKVIKVVLDEGDKGGRRRIKDKPGETHKEGQRIRYFPDDDRQTLQSMFEKEKRNTVENENALFSRLIGKGAKATADYDMDDIYTDKASSSKTERKEKERELREIIDEDKVYKATLENCNWCFDGNKLQKNLVIAVGERSYLCLPPHQSLTEGHCLIVPMYHTTCATQLDEDVWEEMQKFRKAVVRMFSDQDEDVVIFELAVFLKKHPHMYLECVPMPKEVGELAPIYFKKAIQECETEWSQNKKVVDLRNRNVRKAVPKGLPYFSVDFGLDSGFAHVIEDERSFPRNFANEIIGGMLELDHSVWRKQRQDDFKTQRGKVMKFLKIWGNYDWTRGADS